MAKGKEVSIGPWLNGLNLLDQLDQIGDDELIECINLDVDNTGVLVPRRGIRYVAVDNTTDTKYLLGTIILDTETTPKAVVARVNAGTSTFRLIGNPTTAIQNFTATRSGTFKSIVQYGGKLWWIPADASSVGASSPANLTNTFSAIATMPWGDYGFVLKDRLFIVRKSTSELYFSTPTAFEPNGTFTAPWSSTAPNSGGVIQVNPGDNQTITKVVVVNNQIVIFKRDSTYVLSFTSSPTGDGVLRQVSADQGAIDAITYNNEIYCFNSRSVFKFVNGYFQDIGLKLNFPDKDSLDTTSTPGTRINVVGKRLIVGATPSGKTYSMNLDTGAWSKYDYSDTDVSLSTGTVFSRSSFGTAIFFGDGTTKICYMPVTKTSTARTDLNSAGVYRAPKYQLNTKFFSFEDRESWKRLYSWWLDAIFADVAYGSVQTDKELATSGTPTNDVTNLIGSQVSTRFRTVSFNYAGGIFDSAAATPVGPEIRAIKALIGAKAPVSV